MQTQLDHNAYSALESDSEEPESGELSALLSNPDLDVANSVCVCVCVCVFPLQFNIHHKSKMNLRYRLIH